MDIERLISVVRHYPRLWGTEDGDFKDKLEKRLAWIKVSKILFEDYGKQSEYVQNSIVQDVESKWRTVRDKYVRSLEKQSIKSDSEAMKVYTYIYGDKLSFLKTTLQPRPTCSTVDTQPDSPENECDEDNRETEDCHAPTANETMVSPQQLPSSGKGKLMDVERSFIKFMESHRTKAATPQEDEDLAFFYSILPTVKRLTPNEKFTFRMESMKLLQNLKQARSFPPYQG